MKPIDIFYQGESIREIDHLDVEPEDAFHVVKARLIEKHGLDQAVLIFIEDHDEPVEEAVLVGERAGAAGVKAHLHRCREVEVTVTHNGDTVERKFGPGTTVARVKRWAAEEKFGMSRDEAGEHALQIVGTHERPAGSVHIGTLTACPICRLAFHLVPDERINGAGGPRA